MANKSTITENDAINEGLTKNSKIYTNLSQEVVLTTEDKIRICLMNYLNKMGKKDSWMTPAGILLTILITLATTEPKGFIISAESWTTLFVVTGIISFIWLLFSFRYLFKSVQIDDVIDELKKGSPVKEDGGHIVYIDDSGENEEDETFQIIKATYGIPGNNVNITDKLTSLIVNGRLDIQVTNSLVSSDPVPGTKKFLELEFVYKGIQHSKTFKEQENISLP